MPRNANCGVDEREYGKREQGNPGLGGPVGMPVSAEAHGNHNGDYLFLIVFPND